MRILTIMFSLMILVGCSTKATRGEFDECNTISDCSVTVMEKITSNWARPSSLKDDQEKLKRMEASFEVKLNSLYDIETVFISKSSGNEEFDNSALRAIALSAPFYDLAGLPVDEYVKRFKPFFITFRPEDLIK